MNRKEIMYAEMTPDLYAGKNCDEMRPLWTFYAEGDREKGCEEKLILSAKNFFPGAKITITEPVCPQCGQIASVCQHDEDCNFNWREWINGIYS